MSYRAGLFTGILLTIALAVPGLLFWSAIMPKRGAEAAKPVSPANVPKPLKEEELLTLTADAETRLKITTAKVERKPMPRQRKLGGELTIPPGQTVLVSAPVAGTLRSPPMGSPIAGSIVAKGKLVFELLPLLSPETRTTLATSKINAIGQVDAAKAQLDNAKIALDLELKILDTTGTKRAVNDAQAKFDQAKSLYDAANASLKILTSALAEAEKGVAMPFPIEAPEGGLLRTVSALAGQSVPSGGAIFEVVDLKKLWIRVPVFVGEAKEYSRDDVAIVPLNAGPNRKAVTAKRVAAPPSANPLANTVDLFFQVDNADGVFHPGERVGVEIPLIDAAESLTLPWSAVVIDIYGGTWVYESLGEHKYARRRVQVRFVRGDTAVLETGPPQGKTIVAVGAQELFGTEVKFGK